MHARTIPPFGRCERLVILSGYQVLASACDKLTWIAWLHCACNCMLLVDVLGLLVQNQRLISWVFYPHTLKLAVNDSYTWWLSVSVLQTLIGLRGFTFFSFSCYDVIVSTPPWLTDWSERSSGQQHNARLPIVVKATLSPIKHSFCNSASLDALPGDVRMRFKHLPTINADRSDAFVFRCDKTIALQWAMISRDDVRL